MAIERCPNCEEPVRAGDDSCPSCGTDLQPTFTAETGGKTSAAEVDFLPGQVFADRFTIIERIGAGGMGVVYKAVDNAIGATVALKLIRPRIGRMPVLVERFRREVRITRQITHPNVCRVHDLGEAEGVLYLSMEWIDGETLQRLLRQTGTLREGRALQIAERIARALEAAHEKGVIHRDLKPSNVMLDQRGHVSVLDFGLAAEPGAARLSGEGAVVGTPLYMSPEQKRGDPVDARSDLFALGRILREMLTGPLDATPAPSVSAPIEPVLGRLLADRPEERYASAVEARRALERLMAHPEISVPTPAPGTRPAGRFGTRRWAVWLGMGAAAATLLALSVLVLWQRPVRDRPRDPRALAFLERGLQLLRDAEHQGDLDNAVRLLHMSLDVEPDSAVVLARLGEAYWLRFHWDRSPQSRDEARRMVDRAYLLDPSLPEVRNARGVGFFHEGKFQAARSELEAAVRADPALAAAWGNLGQVYQALGDYDAGKEALLRGLEVEPGVRMLVHLGQFHDYFGELEQARTYYRRATDLNPRSLIAWNNLGALQLRLGNYDDATLAFRRSIEIRERAEARSNLGTAYYLLDRYDEAVLEYRRAAALEPNQAVYWGNLGDALLVAGEQAQARNAYGKAAGLARERVAREPLAPVALRDLALYCAKAGDSECAVENVQLAVQVEPTSPAPLMASAVVHALLGRDDEAFDWLKRAVERGAQRGEIEAAPELSRLRAHPRYGEILSRVR